MATARAQHHTKAHDAAGSVRELRSSSSNRLGFSGRGGGVESWQQKGEGGVEKLPSFVPIAAQEKLTYTGPDMLCGLLSKRLGVEMRLDKRSYRQINNQELRVGEERREEKQRFRRLGGTEQVNIVGTQMGRLSAQQRPAAQKRSMGDLERGFGLRKSRRAPEKRAAWR